MLFWHFPYMALVIAKMHHRKCIIQRNNERSTEGVNSQSKTDLVRTTYVTAYVSGINIVGGLE